MQDDAIITNGAMMLRFQQASMVFMSITLVSTCVCQSVGSAAGSFALSISRQGVLYVIVLFIMQAAFGYQGVLMSQMVADIGTAVMAAIIILKTIKNIENKNKM